MCWCNTAAPRGQGASELGFTGLWLSCGPGASTCVLLAQERFISVASPLMSASFLLKRQYSCKRFLSDRKVNERKGLRHATIWLEIT